MTERQRMIDFCLAQAEHSRRAASEHPAAEHLFIWEAELSTASASRFETMTDAEYGAEVEQLRQYYNNLIWF